jgi:polysaccharide biosynthesis/export protein
MAAFHPGGLAGCLDSGVRLLLRVFWPVILVLGIGAWSATPAIAADDGFGDYRLAAGDTVRIQVFQNPDLTLEARLSESGVITYPLVGSIRLAGATAGEAEKIVASALRDGGYVKSPQVIITLVQVRGNLVSVLGQVSRPGRYPLDTTGVRLSELLAVAGGVAAGGADQLIVVGYRDGKPFRREIDFPGLFLDGRLSDDIVMAGGDIVFVHRAPVFYIYGEIQRPGAHRIERKMTVQQALVTAGGPSLRGTERGLRLHRLNADGKVESIEPGLTDPVRPDDVFYVRESLF